MNYSWAKGRRDLIAGLTVAAVALPQGIAYALIAGVDPKFGVYSAIVVTAIASIFGSSSHLINGPTSAISLLVFSSLAFIDPENRTVLFEALFLLGVLVGVIQILIAVFKLGDLTRYISESVIIGFMLAAAFLLAIGQTRQRARRQGQGQRQHAGAAPRLYLTLFHGDAINFRAVFLSVTAMALAVVLRRLVERFGWPQIDLLTVLIVAARHRLRGGMVDPGNRRQDRGVARREGPAEPADAAHPDVDLGSLGQAFPGRAWRSPSSASSRRCRSRKPLRTSRSRRSTTTGRSWPRAWPTSPAASSRACPARDRCRGRRSTFRPVRRPGSPESSPRRRWPWRCCCSRHCCTTFRRPRWRACCSSPRCGWSTSSGWSTTVKASRYDAGLVIVTALTGVLIDLDKAVLLGIALSILLFVPRAAKLKAAELIVTPERVVRERVPGDPAIRRWSSTTSRASCSSAPLRTRPLLRHAAGANPRRRVEFVILRLKRVRHPDAVCIERLEHFLREHNGQRRDDPAGRRATGHAEGAEQHRLRQLVPGRAGVPRGGHRSTRRP